MFDKVSVPTVAAAESLVVGKGRQRGDSLNAESSGSDHRGPGKPG